ncbi:hypothetical protein [Nocardia sp. NRRL S-836]|nr:hypothetical protein [Nocardia sp. NRRL S-836]
MSTPAGTHPATAITNGGYPRPGPPYTAIIAISGTRGVTRPAAVT